MPRRTGRGPRCCDRSCADAVRAVCSVRTPPDCSASCRSFRKLSLSCSSDEQGSDDTPPVQFALFDAVAALLQEFVADQACVVILDDLHAADHDSLRLLHFLARDLPHTKLVVIGTYRGDDAVRTGADALLTKLSREGRILPLRGLTESQVGQLVEQIAGERAAGDVVRTVHRATNGNPLYVDSITHLLVAEERLNPLESPAGDRGGPGHPAVAPEHARRDADTPRPTSTTSHAPCCASPPSSGAPSRCRCSAWWSVGSRTRLLDLLDDAVNRGTIRIERQRCRLVRLRAHSGPRRPVPRARTESAGGAALARRQRSRGGPPR